MGEDDFDLIPSDDDDFESSGFFDELEHDDIYSDPDNVDMIYGNELSVEFFQSDEGFDESDDEGDED